MQGDNLNTEIEVLKSKIESEKNNYANALMRKKDFHSLKAIRQKIKLLTENLNTFTENFRT